MRTTGIIARILAAMMVAGCAVAVAAPPEGMQWETAAIQAKIDAAAAKGGGCVTVGLCAV